MSSTVIPIDTRRRQPYLLETTRQDVALRGLPESLHGLLIAHITDMHAGFGNTDAVFDEAVHQVESVQPELILFTGDYINDSTRIRSYPMAALLRRFRAPLGVFGSFGNHDHRRGIVTTRRLVEEGGVRVLNNQNVCIGSGLWLAGVDDLFEGRPNRSRALEGIPDGVTAVLLSHNPRFVEQVADRDLLVLSGHTHGAQIALPFPTPQMVCKFHLHCDQVAGWYTYGRSRLYVNRGLGVTGQPFRFRCPAELAFYRLVPAPVETESRRIEPVRELSVPGAAVRR